MAADASWQCYRVVLRAESPIHLGWHRLGLIERTRYYIPARSIWGALCAGLARVKYAFDGVPLMYHKAEALCECNQLRFTPFFAAAAENTADDGLWRPRYHADGLRYGDYTPEKIEQLLVYSQASTAIEPSQWTAQSGALHETEYLAPEWNGNDRRHTLHFAGYIFFRDPIDVGELERVLETMQMGGERHRGWGRLKRARFEPHSGVFFEAFEFDPEKHFLEMTATAQASLPAHLECTRDDRDFIGDVEVVSGRSWGPTGPGQKHALKPRFCWAPGTRCSDGRFVVGAEGVWRRAT